MSRRLVTDNHILLVYSVNIRQRCYPMMERGAEVTDVVPACVSSDPDKMCCVEIDRSVLL